MSEIAAGWYPDPQDATHDRFWDGRSWTTHRNPRPPAPAAVAPAVAGPTSGGAVTALVLGILSLVGGGFVLGIPAMVFGRKSAKRIDASQGRLSGRGLATAGFVTGLIGTIWTGLIALLVVLVFVFGGAMQGAFTESCSGVSGATATNCS